MFAFIATEKVIGITACVLTDSPCVRGLYLSFSENLLLLILGSTWSYNYVPERAADVSSSRLSRSYRSFGELHTCCRNFSKFAQQFLHKILLHDNSNDFQWQWILETILGRPLPLHDSHTIMHAKAQIQKATHMQKLMFVAYHAKLGPRGHAENTHW